MAEFCCHLHARLFALLTLLHTSLRIDLHVVFNANFVILSYHHHTKKKKCLMVFSWPELHVRQLLKKIARVGQNSMCTYTCNKTDILHTDNVTECFRWSNNQITHIVRVNVLVHVYILRMDVFDVVTSWQLTVLSVHGTSSMIGLDPTPLITLTLPTASTYPELEPRTLRRHVSDVRLTGSRRIQIINTSILRVKSKQSNTDPHNCFTVTLVS